jgi:hypothetical protein
MYPCIHEYVSIAGMVPKILYMFLCTIYEMHYSLLIIAQNVRLIKFLRYCRFIYGGKISNRREFF